MPETIPKIYHIFHSERNWNGGGLKLWIDVHKNNTLIREIIFFLVGKKILTGEKIFENVYEKRKIACVKMILHPLKYKNSAKDGFHVHFSFSCGKNTGHT